MITPFTAATLEAADKVIDDKNACVDAVILDCGMPDGDSKCLPQSRQTM
jgi:DNA-binding response OmpR family regulator